MSDPVRESLIQQYVSAFLDVLRLPSPPSSYRLSHDIILTTSTRGIMHLIFSIVSILYGIYMWILHGNSRKSKILISILSLFSFILYGTSSLFHLQRYQSSKSYLLAKKLDHQNIVIMTFFLIFIYCYGIFDLQPEWIRTLVKVQAFLMVLFLGKTWLLLGRLSHKANVFSIFGLYVPAMYYMPSICSLLSEGEVVCVISGTIIVATLCVCFANKYPDILPRTFGYHEVMHLLGMIVHIVFMYPVHYLIVHGHRM